MIEIACLCLFPPVIVNGRVANLYTGEIRLLRRFYTQWSVSTSGYVSIRSGGFLHSLVIHPSVPCFYTTECFSLEYVSTHQALVLPEFHANLISRCFYIRFISTSGLFLHQVYFYTRLFYIMVSTSGYRAIKLFLNHGVLIHQAVVLQKKLSKMWF